MPTNIIFTCPVCAGHELQQIQQAIHRIPITLHRSKNGEYTATTIGSVQELKGRILGYRCAHCRYPDVPNHEDADGFYWQSIDDITAAGALTTQENTPCRAPIVCTICQPNGTTHSITHTPSTTGTLSIAERAAHHAPAGSILLMQGE